jgi:hypothetical protein
VYWMNVAQSMGNWPAVWNTEMNLRIPSHAGDLLTT